MTKRKRRILDQIGKTLSIEESGGTKEVWKDGKQREIWYLDKNGEVCGGVLLDENGRITTYYD